MEWCVRFHLVITADGIYYLCVDNRTALPNLTCDLLFGNGMGYDHSPAGCVFDMLADGILKASSRGKSGRLEFFCVGFAEYMFAVEQ